MKIRPELQNISAGYAQEAARRLANEPGSENLTTAAWHARWEAICMQLVGGTPVNRTPASDICG
ncbi:MAG: hypothetical protein RSP_18120 [Rhodanobacter sp.]